MEMSVECVYPIPEATSSGFLFIGGQLIGFIMILVYPEASGNVSITSYTYTNIQTCTNANSTLDNDLSVLDYKYPLIAQASILTLVSIIFTIFFKCPYLRLAIEQERN